MEGRIFIHNSGYDCRGINLELDVEYIGIPKEEYYSGDVRPEERIVELLSYFEIAWREYPDLRMGQLMLNLVPEEKLYEIEDSELLKIMKRYLEPNYKGEEK